MKKLTGFIFFLLILGESLAPADAFQWGRNLKDRKTFEVDITAGKVVKIEGSVEETIRPYYQQIGEDTQGESYTLSELGLDGKKATFGFAIEQKWKFITLEFGGFYYNPTSDTTALRDYYLGISNDIEYQGKDYEYMMIPEGQHFTADLKSFFCELDILITPVTLAPSPNFEFVPFFYLGLTGIFGTYDIDAGPPTGTTVYEDPPRDYVIGGQTDGWMGAGMPGVGLGGEIRIGPSDGLRLVLEGRYVLFRYNGSTKYIPVSIRHEKDLDLDYDNYEAKVQLELPLSEKLDIVLGISYEYVKIDAEATAIEKSPEEIEDEREKFDKKIDFELSEFHGFVGLKF